MKLNVSDIQHFSTGDGPGIRSTVFLKGCNLHCPWCHNPETISAKTQTLYFEKADKTRVFGHLLTVDEVLKDVLEDEEFYLASGGGVTVSGGEPLLQAEVVTYLLKQLKERKIHTVIDTAGCVPYEKISLTLPYCNTYYFDYKTPFSEKYKAVVGGDEALIFQNLTRLISDGGNVHVRIPLIPDFNVDEKSVNATMEKLKSIGIKYVDLLPFHRLASSKYEALGKNYPYANVSPLEDEQIKGIYSVFGNHFITSIEK